MSPELLWSLSTPGRDAPDRGFRDEGVSFGARDCRFSAVRASMSSGASHRPASSTASWHALAKNTIQRLTPARARSESGAPS